ncbi:MAG: hypothetical protein JW891_07335 [Candidatus Lokiarchaeota archaeon]|nr:hypothetical protein [Candidatus Lokiarchaeota archaeon]
MDKKFDKKYVLLEEMYKDPYFPKRLVDKVKEAILKVIKYLEKGEHSLKDVQEKFDEMTNYINDLQDEFEENGSELETGARESIWETIDYVVKYFNIDIDGEEALRERDW